MVDERRKDTRFQSSPQLMEGGGGGRMRGGRAEQVGEGREGKGEEGGQRGRGWG